MKILFVEDDDFKTKQVSELIRDILPEVDLTVARSVNMGMKAFKTDEFNLVLLDMSLPSFDKRPGDSGNLPQSFGGMEIMSYVDRFDLSTKVLVITQFEKLGTGSKQMDIVTLKDKLQNEYPSMFLGLIYFSATSDEWRLHLKEALDPLSYPV